jgi:hypothetical protein
MLGASAYQDEPIQIGVTSVQALHIAELGTAINILRNHFGLANHSWTTSATTSDYVNARSDHRDAHGATTYYIRSAVLGGQVIAELSSNGNWSRG